MQTLHSLSIIDLQFLVPAAKEAFKGLFKLKFVAQAAKRSYIVL